MGSQSAFPVLLYSLLSSGPAKGRFLGRKGILKAGKVEQGSETEAPEVGWDVVVVNGTLPTATPLAVRRVPLPRVRTLEIQCTSLYA